MELSSAFSLGSTLLKHKKIMLSFIKLAGLIACHSCENFSPDLKSSHIRKYIMLNLQRYVLLPWYIKILPYLGFWSVSDMVTTWFCACDFVPPWYLASAYLCAYLTPIPPVEKHKTVCINVICKRAYAGKRRFNNFFSFLRLCLFSATICPCSLGLRVKLVDLESFIPKVVLVDYI